MGTLSVLAVSELLRLHGPTAPAGLPAGHAKHVLPTAVIPIGRKVAETIPQLADAAGGEALLITSADKGTVDRPSVISGTWAAGLLLVDAKGLVTARAVRGSVWVEACQAASLDIAYNGKDWAKARAAGEEFATSQTPVQLSGDKLLLSVWMRERVRTIKNRLGVSLADGGFPSISMDKFSPSGWFEAAPALASRVVQVDGWVTSPDTLRLRATALESEVRALEQASAARSQQSSTRVGDAGSPPLGRTLAVRQKTMRTLFHRRALGAAPLTLRGTLLWGLGFRWRQQQCSRRWASRMHAL